MIQRKGVNRREGSCLTCGKTVAAEAGQLLFLGEHYNCAIWRVSCGDACTKEARRREREKEKAAQETAVRNRAELAEARALLAAKLARVTITGEPRSPYAGLKGPEETYCYICGIAPGDRSAVRKIIPAKVDGKAIVLCARDREVCLSEAAQERARMTRTHVEPTPSVEGSRS